ncbi:bifunctional AP-4-A phosphorylase/ADP sulfurylase NDAI_0A00250 [Naumovozyma dairenensis CBS 421]|uniref:Uncharacterized protein n=1 Tax=Naumovozyma dairenensis (strain ATCC 10597 / BCRC 20456 / CBS 421 / NBRC 0211 / NRRL Y-12639) TaxID=1071378 RepID=G0W5H1_NAUDC|nr:hypothetical protein NDAI_0A00250 [Naumovozyma dairenensis CBS 421]CCD22185.1 hypothetical protein NDAI_0A00250 [Naumovozyma dairenensis CBS 421]
MFPANISQLIKEKYDLAYNNGHLKFLQTDSRTVNDSNTGMQYVVSFAPSLLKKPERGDTPKNVDPLGNSEPELTVLEDLFQDKEYKLVLNKYPIISEHSLLVTNEFKHQTSSLTSKELLQFYELIAHLDENNEQSRHTIFYNCGPASGSSLDHKHLQLIKLPSDLSPFQDKLLSREYHFSSTIKNEEPLQDRNISFAHFVLPLPKSTNEIDETFLQRCYKILLQKLKTVCQNETFISHNLILTKNWICLIPRSSTKARTLRIGFNSVGYLGIVLVKFQDVFDQIVENPQLLNSVLLECGFPNTLGQIQI